MTETLEVRVRELDCAEEARQIEAALERLSGVADVRTVVSSRTALITYDPRLVAPEAIRGAIRSLGMTVAETGSAEGAPRRSLADRLGWAFVSVVALSALVGIVGERLGSVDALAERVPAWVSVAAVLAGGYPIFRNVLRALRNRQIPPTR